MHDLSQLPTFAPDPRLFGEPDITPVITPTTTLGKRQPGRPKAESPYNQTLQLRLSKDQLERVEQLAEKAKCSRSAVIRACLEQMQLVQAAPHPEQQQLHRELVRLTSNLNQLIKMAHTNKAVVDETQQTVKQVRSLLEQMTNKSI